jgi:transposase-like protein
VSLVIKTIFLVRIRYEYSHQEGGFYMAIAKEQLLQIIKENDIQNVGDIYNLLKDSFKDMMQEMLEVEMDVSLGYLKNEKSGLVVDNKRNGYTPKTVKNQYGEFEVDVPRDRNAEFEPKIIPKYQRDISGIEEKVISLYARGMSTRDIHDQLQDIYGIELSAEMVSKITDRIIPDIKEWQSRPLNPICIHS